MNIYIAYDLDTKPMGVLLADSRDKAELAFTAMGEIPISVEEIDPLNAENNIGVIFLLTSKSRMVSSPMGGYKIRIWKRGLS